MMHEIIICIKNKIQISSSKVKRCHIFIFYLALILYFDNFDFSGPGILDILIANAEKGNRNLMRMIIVLHLTEILI